MKKNTGNVIHFPIKDEKALRQILHSIESIYAKAGLNQQEINSAIIELEPLLRPFIASHQTEMALDKELNLNAEQIDAITLAHNKCVQEFLDFYYMQLNLALTTISGLIGSKHHNI